MINEQVYKENECERKELAVFIKALFFVGKR